MPLDSFGLRRKNGPVVLAQRYTQVAVARKRTFLECLFDTSIDNLKLLANVDFKTIIREFQSSKSCTNAADERIYGIGEAELFPTDSQLQADYLWVIVAGIINARPEKFVVKGVKFKAGSVWLMLLHYIWLKYEKHKQNGHFRQYFNSVNPAKDQNYDNFKSGEKRMENFGLIKQKQWAYSTRFSYSEINNFLSYYNSISELTNTLYNGKNII